MHLISVIPENDTTESVFGHRNFPRCNHWTTPHVKWGKGYNLLLRKPRFLLAFGAVGPVWVLRWGVLLAVPGRYFFCGSFVFLFCLVFAVSLCASVCVCFVVACWGGGAGLLARVCGVYCEFVTFPLVSWVRCGTWLYRFLIFAPLLTWCKYYLYVYSSDLY